MASVDLNTLELGILIEALETAIADWSGHGTRPKDPNSVDLLEKLERIV